MVQISKSELLKAWNISWAFWLIVDLLNLCLGLYKDYPYEITINLFISGVFITALLTTPIVLGVWKILEVIKLTYREKAGFTAMLGCCYAIPCVESILFTQVVTGALTMTLFFIVLVGYFLIRSLREEVVKPTIAEEVLDSYHYL